MGSLICSYIKKLKVRDYGVHTFCHDLSILNDIRKNCEFQITKKILKLTIRTNISVYILATLTKATTK